MRMSAGAVFQEALRILNRQRLPAISQRDLLAVLEAGRPAGPLAFLYDAGVEARLPRQKLLTRTAAIYINFCAGNLADDLIDGECTYLDEPFRIGPCAQFILQNLFFHILAEEGLPGPTLSTATLELVVAAGPQHLEVRTKQWSAPVFREVVEGSAGHQWSAYLQVLWCGTALAGRAAAVGMNAGIAARVAGDIRSGDVRYTTLPKADKRKIVAWAVAAARALSEENLRCFDALLQWVDPALKEAL
jgi:hypothetical protein